MSECPQNAPDFSRQPALANLAQLFEKLLGPIGSWQLLETIPLQVPNPRAFRMRFEQGNRIASYIAKRLEPQIAQRNYLLLNRWLPAVGLSDHALNLLGVAAEPNGKYLWQVYEDLGNCALTPESPLSHIKPAVELIAHVHLRFANHPLLAECRLNGGDLGANFFNSTVCDAVRAVKKLRHAELSSEQSKLCERLLVRLHCLTEEGLIRTREIEELGGPETLLHGDLWTTNTFVVPEPNGLRARLIDWDHAAVGPITYDLSTFLLRFPNQRREVVLELYREAVSGAEWRLPSACDLNRLFETAEFSRFANRIIWPAIAFLQERAQWAFDALAEVEQWFEDWKPVLLQEKQALSASPGNPARASSHSAARNGGPQKVSDHLTAAAPG